MTNSPIYCCRWHVRLKCMHTKINFISVHPRMTDIEILAVFNVPIYTKQEVNFEIYIADRKATTCI